MTRRRPGQRLHTIAVLMQLGAILAGLVTISVYLGYGGLELAGAALLVAVGVYAGGSMLRGRLRRQVRAKIQRSRQYQVLGRLRYADEDDWWEAEVRIDDTKLGFMIGGDDAPHPALLAHAREIVASFAEFRDKVRAFLVEECATFEDHYADEIRALEIADVCLFAADRPRDGMIYFNGPNERRVWRCDYVDGQPRLLGFDS